VPFKHVQEEPKNVHGDHVGCVCHLNKTFAMSMLTNKSKK